FPMPTLALRDTTRTPFANITEFQSRCAARESGRNSVVTRRRSRATPFSVGEAPMPIPMIDLTGRRFGRLVVLAYVENRKWSCACDCGAHTVVHGDNLRRGTTKSCGHLRGARRIDLTGQRIGRWRVLAYAGQQKWFCVCRCGTRRAVEGDHLRGGWSTAVPH